jgi:hypothetical protein
MNNAVDHDALGIPLLLPRLDGLMSELPDDFNQLVARRRAGGGAGH